MDHQRAPVAEEHTAVTTTATQIERPDGRVELVDTTTVERSPLYNEDLAPVPISARNWTTYNYAALWISMDLVQKMKAAKRSKAGEASRDNEWAQKDITEKTAELTSN